MESVESIPVGEETLKLLSTVHMIANALARPKQHIRLQEIPSGRVLDVGGGGEGVVAQAGGARVVAIDRLVSEIYEARGKAADAAWLVADATGLPCKSGCFDNATAFFSCMYMPENVKQGVFAETRRVLKEGGEFWLWDVPMASRSKVHVIRLGVELQDGRIINTAYGVRAKDQAAGSLCALLEGAGFEAEILTGRKHWFLIRARKMQ
jgi:SAM-dependent methyltransferase